MLVQDSQSPEKWTVARGIDDASLHRDRLRPFSVVESPISLTVWACSDPRISAIRS